RSVRGARKCRAPPHTLEGLPPGAGPEPHLHRRGGARRDPRRDHTRGAARRVSGGRARVGGRRRPGPAPRGHVCPFGPRRGGTKLETRNPRGHRPREPTTAPTKDGGRGRWGRRKVRVRRDRCRRGSGHWNPAGMVMRSIPHNVGSMKSTPAMMRVSAIRFSQNPVLTMSMIETLPVPNMIAFGGVPTGSMNAQFAAIAQGTINAYG